VNASVAIDEKLHIIHITDIYSDKSIDYMFQL